jgi:hypothetical protein
MHLLIMQFSPPPVTSSLLGPNIVLVLIVFGLYPCPIFYKENTTFQELDLLLSSGERYLHSLVH